MLCGNHITNFALAAALILEQLPTHTATPAKYYAWAPLAGAAPQPPANARPTSKDKKMTMTATDLHDPTLADQLGHTSHTSELVANDLTTPYDEQGEDFFDYLGV